MKTASKSLILNRGLLFAFSLTALVWGYINIVLTGSIAPMHSMPKATNLQFFMYATIWSNIFCFIWSVLGMVSIIQENKKLENIINHWGFKAAPVMWIAITLLVFNFVLIPVSMYENGVVWTIKAYFGISIFQHVLVPIFMVNDFRLTKGFNKKDKFSLKEIMLNTSIAIIPGIIWITISILLLWHGNIKPQYFFMHFFGESKKTIIINSVIVASVVGLFFIGHMSLFLYHNKQHDIKNNKIVKKKITKR